MGRPKATSKSPRKNKNLNIRISEEDLNVLNRICEKLAITKTDFIIGCIKENSSVFCGTKIQKL